MLCTAFACGLLRASRHLSAGPIPPELGQLHALEILALSRNKLSGEIRIAPCKAGRAWYSLYGYSTQHVLRIWELSISG